MIGKTLIACKLTREDFAPFGDVIEARGVEHFAINAGTSERFNDLADIDVQENSGRVLVNIFRAQPQSLPISIKALERHPLSSQAFVPLRPLPFLLVVAPPGDDLDIATLRVFITDGHQGINFRRGVWHHPLISTEEADFLVIDRGGPGDNCDVVSLPEKVQIG